jgi:hypothetical protein
LGWFTAIKTETMGLHSRASLSNFPVYNLHIVVIEKKLNLFLFGTWVAMYHPLGMPEVYESGF